MKATRNLIAALVIAVPGAVAAPPSADTPLIEDGAARVTAGDLSGYLLRMPEKVRGEAMMSYEHIATMVDAVFLNRVFALKARELGFDKDPAVQSRLVQVQEALLSELYFQDLDKKASIPNLEPRARELYKADPARFTTAEHVNVQRIIISFNKRTQETALERARQARAEALAAGSKEGFLAAAAKYNDDPDRKRHGGDLGLMGTKSFPDPVTQAIARMKTRGEVSEPIETEGGYHLIRFEERKPGELVPYEAVASKLMEAERDRILRDRRSSQVNDVRASKTVVVHRANVESLVVPFDAAAAVQRATGQKPQ